MDFSKFVENIGDSTATSFVCFDENDIFLFRLTSESKKEYIFYQISTYSHYVDWGLNICLT